MHPLAFAANNRAFERANMPQMRIVQTCTGALGRRVVASAGTHDADGTLPGTSERYAASADYSTWRVRGVVRWDEQHIRWMLYNLALEGFAAWYRYRGSFATNLHIHAVYCGVAMKEQSQFQVCDFLWNRDGLKGHQAEPFWTAGADVDARIKRLFLLHNPDAGYLFK
jgi:hypothetical protein